MNKLLRDRATFIRCMMNVLVKQVGDFGQTDLLKLQALIKTVREDAAGHFLSISQDAPMQVSYARRPEDKNDSKRRIRVSFGKYIKRNLKTGLSDDAINMLVSYTWAGYSGANAKVQTLKGEEITKAYAAFGETEAHSCMTGGSAKLTEFYAVNPDKVCMVVLDQVRALLWTTDNGTKVLDRAYPSSNQKIAALREWAEKRGYVLRVNPDKLDTNNTVELSDDKIYSVTMKKTNRFPYLDTFCFGNFTHDNKVILTNENDDQDITFHHTDGGYDENEHSHDDEVTCEQCNETVDAEESCSFHDETWCNSCYRDRVVTCHNCDCEMDRNDEDVYSVSSRYYCETCFNERYFICFSCGNYKLQDDKITCLSNDEDYCEDCADTDLISCNECGEYYKQRNVVLIDGEYYCKKDCATKCEDCDTFLIGQDEEYCVDCSTKKEEEAKAVEALTANVSEGEVVTEKVIEVATPNTIITVSINNEFVETEHCFVVIDDRECVESAT